MKNIKITRKITQGMYVLTTKDGGCIVDAVSQISSGDNPLIAVSVMKKNNTNILLKNNNTFAISILSNDVDANIIKTFGFASSRDIDKFENIDTLLVNDINIIKDSIGYMVCEVIDSIDNDTHTLFIGKIIEADVLNDKEPMSYAYYTKHKEDLLKVKTNNEKTAWVCQMCGYVYYGETLKEDFKCPVCMVGKEYFIRKEN